jgi:hypothetical protein
MRKTMTIEVPTTWKDVPLKKYLALMSDLENYKDDEEAQTALMLLHLCNIQPEYLKGLSKQSYDLLRAKLSQFIQPDDIPLQRIINIGGREYGFEPNLSKMSYGAYADITQYEQITIDKNWAKIMSILYRPVTNKNGEFYNIQPYTGEENPDIFLDVDMETNFGALFFFVHLSMDLLNAIPKYLKETELPASIRQTLVKSGELTQHLWNSQTMTYSK